MEKIKLSTETGSKAEMVGNFWRIEKALNNIADWINKQEHSLDWIEEAHRKRRENGNEA